MASQTLEFKNRQCVNIKKMQHFADLESDLNDQVKISTFKNSKTLSCKTQHTNITRLQRDVGFRERMACSGTPEHQ